MTKKQGQDLLARVDHLLEIVDEMKQPPTEPDTDARPKTNLGAFREIRRLSVADLATKTGLSTTRLAALEDRKSTYASTQERAALEKAMKTDSATLLAPRSDEALDDYLKEVM